jgi:hypothetical protein
MLGERHGFEEWQETVLSFIFNLAADPAEESEHFASMSRAKLIIKNKWSRQLEKFAPTGIEQNFPVRTFNKTFYISLQQIN